MLRTSIVAGILAQALSVAAHGGITSYSVGSTTYPGWQPYSGGTTQNTAERTYPSYDPITSATSANMACNNNGGTGNSGQTDITIAAGSSITSYWPQWTHAPGPVTVYMAKCPGSSCTGVNDATLTNWFKIQEVGLISGTVYDGKWGLGIVQDTLKWTATIPASLAPGAYFYRVELLALHQANAPQFYPECAQLIVTGSGTASPTSQYLVSIPGAWSANDPSININIYSDAAKTMTSYTVAGPPVWPPVGGGGTTTKPPTTTTTTTPPTTTPTTSAPTTTTTKPPTCTVAQYGQCGGSGYSGCTTCASPWTCKVSNQYYSQCL